jgi:hypothetical protein
VIGGAKVISKSVISAESPRLLESALADAELITDTLITFAPPITTFYIFLELDQLDPIHRRSQPVLYALNLR